MWWSQVLAAQARSGAGTLTRRALSEAGWCGPLHEYRPSRATSGTRTRTQPMTRGDQDQGAEADRVTGQRGNPLASWQGM